MTNLEKIRSAEENVAKLQEQLDHVQRALQRTEELATAAAATKEEAWKLTLVAGVVFAAGMVLVVASRKRGR